MSDFRVPVVQVETHLTHACNFTCEGCTHFSNEGYSGRETAESFYRNVKPWSKRIWPGAFLLLGGEPTLNPELCEIVEIARRLWPEPSVRIMLVTNGWFLHRHPRLQDVLPVNNVRLDISLHDDSPEYLEKISEIRAMLSSWGIAPYFRQSHRDWTKVIQGVGSEVAPYADGDPEASWTECVSKWCLNIHEGKLWKCPVLAYLPMHVARYGDPDGKWEPYLRYEALSPEATIEQVRKFTSKQCESFCAMCPAKPEPFAKPSPLRRRPLPVTTV